MNNKEKLFNAVISAAMVCCITNPAQASISHNMNDKNVNKNMRSMQHEIPHDHLPEELLLEQASKKQGRFLNYE